MAKSNAILQDPGIERAILAGIITHGVDCFFEVEDLIGTKDFYWPRNQEIFNTISYLVHKEDIKTFDFPSLQAAAKTLGYDELIMGGKHSEFLQALVDEHGPSRDNVRSLTVTIYKFSLARRGWLATKTVQNNLRTITGTEDVDTIIGQIEEPIFEFTGQVMSQGGGIVSLGQKFQNVMSALTETPQDIVGLPTGFPLWDMAIGGGLRPATVNVIGARPKIGKSFFCINIARNIAENNVPVLYLDTELTWDIQLHRLASLISGIELNKIETGKFASDPNESDAVWSCQEHMEKLPIDHFLIAGLAPHAIMSIARRWLSKKVGFNSSGLANPCLIIYDYLKLMDDDGFKKNLQEYQLLGFLVTALHNFAAKFKLPILATVQLNRDGIERENSGVISGSDRIMWLCSNFTILKKKIQTELNEDPPSNGTKKLVVTDTRYGPGMENGEYINMIDHLQVAKFSEGKSFSAAIQSTLGSQANE